MLDLKFVRDNTEKVAQALKNRHAKVDLEEFKKLDQERRSLLQEVEADKSQRNTVSAEISQMTQRRKSPPCGPWGTRSQKRTKR